jgi:acetolactate synthase-1/2/3 large subunit
MSEPPSPIRVGGHLVAETLRALGVRTVFGVPGQHALAIVDGLRLADLDFVASRTEVGASFAAHGFATAARTPAALIVSTGPGALMALAGLQEADATGTPIVCICSEVPRTALSRNQGYVHELRDQIAHFRPVVRRALQVNAPEAIPDVLVEAWRIAATAPSGPVFVQIPVDVLTEPTTVPAIAGLTATPDRRPPQATVVERVAALLDAAQAPLVLAGGGVLRSGAEDALRAVAERLDAPVVETYAGKGTLPADHGLLVGSACEDPGVQRLIGTADVVLAVGTSLSEETTNHFTTAFSGTVVQVEPDTSRVATRYPTLPVVADAGLALDALRQRLGSSGAAKGGAERAARARTELADRWSTEGADAERSVLRAIEAALPADAITCWDMTIMSYWATMDFAARSPRSFLYPQGSGTLGYGFPAAIGAKAAFPDRPVLAVAGDGGIMYGLAEIAPAIQHQLDVTLLVIDDGGYGILRTYQREAYGVTWATDLQRPDFPRALVGLGLDVERASLETLPDALRRSLAVPAPSAVVLDFAPVMFRADPAAAPTAP